MSLANLEKMSAGEKLALLMKGVSNLFIKSYQVVANVLLLLLQVEPDNFADCFEKYATPFLHRQEGHHLGTSEQLLTDYLCVVARDDLRPCLYVFKTAHTKVICCVLLVFLIVPPTGVVSL